MLIGAICLIIGLVSGFVIGSIKGAYGLHKLYLNGYSPNNPELQKTDRFFGKTIAVNFDGMDLFGQHGPVEGLSVRRNIDFKVSRRTDSLEARVKKILEEEPDYLVDVYTSSPNLVIRFYDQHGKLGYEEFETLDDFQSFYDDEDEDIDPEEMRACILLDFLEEAINNYQRLHKIPDHILSGIQADNYRPLDLPDRKTPTAE